MTGNSSDPFFPSIGNAVEQTDRLGDDQEGSDPAGQQDEERPLQEIDSLCMSCGEQASPYVCSHLYVTLQYFLERDVLGCF